MRALRAKQANTANRIIDSLERGKGSPVPSFKGMGELNAEQRAKRHALASALEKNRRVRAVDEISDYVKGGRSSRRRAVLAGKRSISSRTIKALRKQKNRADSIILVDEVARQRRKDARKLYAKRNGVSLLRRIRDYFKGFY